MGEPLEMNRAELKRSKFAFSDADMKGSLIKGCATNVAPWNAVNQACEHLWQEAKQHNKELKNARRKEEEEHAQLYRSIAEAFEEAREAANTCYRELEMLQSQQDLSEAGAEVGQRAFEGEDLDLCPPWTNGPHAEAADNARRGTDELARVASLHQREMEKRTHLEFEMQWLETQLKKAKDRSSTSIQQQKEAHECIKSMEILCQAQLDLGFPDISFNDPAGTVILSGSAAAGVEEALRTVHLEFGKDGRLLRVAAHADLGLQREASEAVKHDDLPAFLTMVWHRICDPAEQKRRKPSRGGA